MSFDAVTLLSQPPHQTVSPAHWVILLAAGESRRLGQPKQLLKKEDQRLIRYMAQLALATEPQGVMVVIPANHAKISHALEGMAVTCIENSQPQQGMATSLSLAISKLDKEIENAGSNFNSADADADKSRPNHHAESAPVLIMGVDQVRLTVAHLLQLLSAHRSARVNVSTDVSVDASTNTHHLPLVTASEYHGVIGLPLVIQWSQLKAWQAQLFGDKGLRHLIRALASEDYRTVPLVELADDIDTPEQLALARQQGWLD